MRGSIKGCAETVGGSIDRVNGCDGSWLLWDIPERSLVKGSQMIKEQAARLAACINDIDDLTLLLQELAERFQVGCRQNTRKNHPNT